MKLRVLLADDHAIYRGAMRMLLDMQTDMEVVAEVANGLGVLRDFPLSRPDVVCMDIGMHGLGGVETTRKLLAAEPAARVIGVSAHADLKLVAQMFQAGALGYVVKGSSSLELLKAIRAVARNQPHFDPTLGVSHVSALVPYFVDPGQGTTGAQ